MSARARDGGELLKSRVNKKRVGARGVIAVLLVLSTWKESDEDRRLVGDLETRSISGDCLCVLFLRVVDRC